MGDNGEIRSSVVHGSHLPAAQLAQEVRTWKVRLRGIEPLAPASIAGVAGRIATLRDVGGGQSAVLDKGWVRGTYEQIGVINDARLLIRDGERLVAGVTLWRPWRASAWTGGQLRLLAALQPLIEMAYLSTARGSSSIDPRLPATLTARQRQVARLLATGATNAEIASALYISPDTAKSHTRAVLAKLGLTSRREVAMRFSHAPAGSASQPDTSWAPRGGSELSIRLEGDQAPRRLLEAVLDWSAERIGAVVGGCAIFSARLELVAEAWGMARAGGQDPDPRTAWRVHRQVLPPSAPAEIVGYLDSHPARPPVLQLHVTGPPPSGDRLGDLVTHLGLTTPLLAVLRVKGRTAGLVWLCRDARTAPGPHESARALRDVHPLLELTHVTRLADGGVSRPGEIGELGLTPREMAVARLAVYGKSNAVIAHMLSISESTVKKHMTRILAKCGVRSRTQLITLLGERPGGDP